MEGQLLQKIKEITGELSAAELNNIMTVIANPRQFKFPDWFLNRKKDYKMASFLRLSLIPLI
ncbi:unnamed protein product [Lupinus luteus]|uniref:Ribosomal protein S18 n=1 Tax=Lupinus luteus TaxID=3873 RepID=A0AAV1VV04_LUPLU